VGSGRDSGLDEDCLEGFEIDTILFNLVAIVPHNHVAPDAGLIGAVSALS
jgi:hypothetical protein